jgi:hypothetical protein
MHVGMKRLPVCLVAATIVVACQDARETAKSDQPSVQQQGVVVGPGQPDSARAFVQRFYDWYLTTKDGEGYDSLLTSRRGMLGDRLFRAFQADVAAQRADTIAEIASLSADADIFLNANDPCEHYATQGVTAAGPGVFAVTVAGDCGEDRRPNIEVYVRKNASGWQIENIKDPTNPSSDLVRDLVQYHQSNPAMPDSVAADWPTLHDDGFTIRYPKAATVVLGQSHPSGMAGMAIQGPRIHVPVPPDVGPSDGPAYRLIISSAPNPHGWSAEQWVDSLRKEANDRRADDDSPSHLAAPDTMTFGTVRALHLRPYCGDCDPHELYVATPKRMIVVSYVFDIGVPGDRDAQARLYRAIVSTLRPE